VTACSTARAEFCSVFNRRYFDASDTNIGSPAFGHAISPVVTRRRRAIMRVAGR
jgi:hypothetical protein